MFYFWILDGVNVLNISRVSMKLGFFFTYYNYLLELLAYHSRASFKNFECFSTVNMKYYRAIIVMKWLGTRNICFYLGASSLSCTSVHFQNSNVHINCINYWTWKSSRSLKMASLKSKFKLIILLIQSSVSTWSYPWRHFCVFLLSLIIPLTEIWNMASKPFINNFFERFWTWQWYLSKKLFFFFQENEYSESFAKWIWSYRVIW